MKTKIVKLGWNSIEEIFKLFYPTKSELQKENYTLFIKIENNILSTPSAITNQCFLPIWITLYNKSGVDLIKNKKYVITFNSLAPDFPPKEMIEKVDKICVEIWEKVIEHKLSDL